MRSPPRPNASPEDDPTQGPSDTEADKKTAPPEGSAV